VKSSNLHLKTLKNRKDFTELGEVWSVNWGGGSLPPLEECKNIIAPPPSYYGVAASWYRRCSQLRKIGGEFMVAEEG